MLHTTQQLALPRLLAAANRCISFFPSLPPSSSPFPFTHKTLQTASLQTSAQPLLYSERALCGFFKNPSREGLRYLPCNWQTQRSLVEVKFRKAEGKDVSKIPFKVLRTPSGNLPVYSRIRKHGTVVTTIIRHAMGDISALKKDLLAICEAPVRERCGTLEVKGLHVLKIKQWLTHLGF